MEHWLVMVMGLGVLLVFGLFIMRNVAQKIALGIVDKKTLITLWDSEFIAYAARYRVDAHVLKAIALWEHRGVIREEAVAREADGTKSYGVFQINERNIPWLTRTTGITLNQLLNPVKNIEAGAALMRQMMNEFGYSLGDIQTSEGKRNNLIQAWSLGTPKVKQGKTNPSYLAGVLGYLEQTLYA